MARSKKPEAVLSADTIFGVLAQQLGGIPDYTVADWDPDMQKFGQAVLEVLATGSCLFLRPGTGAQSFGVAVWEGDVRHPAKWLNEQAHVDEWSSAILQLLATRKKPLAIVKRG